MYYFLLCALQIIPKTSYSYIYLKKKPFRRWLCLTFSFFFAILVSILEALFAQREEHLSNRTSKEFKGFFFLFH